MDDVVSAEHAQLFFDGERYLLRDQGTAQGTAVVRGAERLAVDDTVGREVPLAPGDVIELGTGESAVSLSAAITIDEAARVVAFRKIDDFAPRRAESRPTPGRCERCTRRRNRSARLTICTRWSSRSPTRCSAW